MFIVKIQDNCEHNGNNEIRPLMKGSTTATYSRTEIYTVALYLDHDFQFSTLPCVLLRRINVFWLYNML